MPITEKQRVKRQNYIGGSDVAAIMGVCQYRSPYDVYLDKIGSLPELVENKTMQAGNLLEPGILAYAESELGPIKRNQFRVCNEFSRIAVNCDALLQETGEPVEAKTAGLFGPLSKDWGENGTDEVPLQYILQAHTQMLCTNTTTCHLVAFLGGRGFNIFPIQFNEKLGETIIERCKEFWLAIENQTPPEGATPSLLNLSRMIRTPGKVAQIDSQLIKNYELAKDVEKSGKALADEEKALLLTALDDAEEGITEDGRVVTYYPQTRKAKCCPNCRTTITAETVYPVLRIKKSGSAQLISSTPVGKQPPELSAEPLIINEDQNV